MKRNLLIVLSLILASLLLVVACDDKANDVDLDNSTIDEIVLPAGAPSLDEEDFKEIKEETIEQPEPKDLDLISRLSYELKSFLMVPDGEGGTDISDAAMEILMDLAKAVGEKGVELKGNGFAISVAFDLEKESPEVKIFCSFESFKFDKLTFDGYIKATINPSSKTYSDDTNLKITSENGKATCSTVKEVWPIITKSYEDPLSDAEKKALIVALNNTLQELVKALNDCFESYTIKTDLLTVVLSFNIDSEDLKIKIQEGITLGKGLDLGEGLKATINATVYTNEPLENNGSQYKVFAYGDMKVLVDNYGEESFIVTFEGKANLILETSGKIGEQKVRLQAKVSGNNMEEPEVQAYIVVNEKAINLLELLKK